MLWVSCGGEARIEWVDSRSLNPAAGVMGSHLLRWEGGQQMRKQILSFDPVESDVLCV